MEVDMMESLQIIKLVVLANFIGRKESIIKDNGKTIK
jgi:hypothetical protein